MVESQGKAWFFNKETSDWFDFQYNPKDFKFNKPVNWHPGKEQGQVQKLEFQTIAPATISFDAYFDTTNDDEDVRVAWVNKILELTNAIYTPTDGEVSGTDKKRPPRVYFVWGSFDLLGVIESVDVTYLMFASDGTPKRAKVSVKMKEWTPEVNYQSGGNATYYASDKVEMVQMSAGETISAVAARLGTDARTLMDQNDIDDGMSCEAGTEIVYSTGTGARS